MQLITTKPTIYLVNLTMKDYLRQKSKYLPPIAAWVTTHGGLPRDIIPFSMEFEERLYSLRDDPAALSSFLGESKVKSKLTKIITEGMYSLSSLSIPHLSNEMKSLLTRPGCTKLGLQYYFTGTPPFFPPPGATYPLSPTPSNTSAQLARKRSAAGPSQKAVWHPKPLAQSTPISSAAS